MKYFQFGFFPFSFPCSHSALLEQKTKHNFSSQYFFLLFSIFFHLPCNTTQNINGIFLQWGCIQKKKCQGILKIRVLLLFLMLETELICQIGCSISLWLQHNGEIINRIMDGKQEVLHVCFSLGGFQISQAECNTVFLSCRRKDQLEATAKLLMKRERKAAPVMGCEILTFQYSHFKQLLGFVQLR